MGSPLNSDTPLTLGYRIAEAESGAARLQPLVHLAATGGDQFSRTVRHRASGLCGTDSRHLTQVEDVDINVWNDEMEAQARALLSTKYQTPL